MDNMLGDYAMSADNTRVPLVVLGLHPASCVSAPPAVRGVIDDVIREWLLNCIRHSVKASITKKLQNFAEEGGYYDAYDVR